MKDYEISCIFSGKFSEEEVKKIKENVKKLIEEVGGKILGEESWGKKQLAYPVKKENQGFYEFITFQINPLALADLEKKIRLMDEVLRYLIVLFLPKKIIEEKPKEKKKKIKEKVEKEKKKTEELVPKKLIKKTKPARKKSVPAEKKVPLKAPSEEQYKELEKKLKEILKE